jgi:FKBP-type peptidyl-prolyl cis-trans isomerase
MVLAVALLLSGATLAEAQGSSPAGQSSPPPAAAQPKTPAAGAPAAPAPAVPDKAQASYNFGLYFGMQMRAGNLSPQTISMPDLERGLREALAGTKEFNREGQQAIVNYVQSVRKAIADENHAKAQAFLAANSKKPGVVTTASGLQYKVLTPGKGDAPKPTDTVSVHYTGKLLDGKEFDSTDKQGGQPATFSLGSMIPGWTEALTLMKPGAKWEIYIPPSLAYDLRPPTPVIPPGSMLVFNVELLKVLPPAAPAVPALPPHPSLSPQPSGQQPHN